MEPFKRLDLQKYAEENPISREDKFNYLISDINDLIKFAASQTSNSTRVRLNDDTTEEECQRLVEMYTNAGYTVTYELVVAFTLIINW